MKFNPDEHVKPKQSVKPAAHATGTVNGTAIDTQDFEELLAVLAIGAITGTATLDTKLQHSDVIGSGFVDIPGAVFTQKANADADKTFVGRVNLKGSKQFVRAVSVIAGSTPVVNHAVTLHLSAAQQQLPVTQEQTVAFSVNL